MRIQVRKGERVMDAMARLKKDHIAEIVSDAAINAAKAVEAARLDERERCAKIAEKAFHIGTGHPYDQGFIAGCKAAANAIRKLV